MSLRTGLSLITMTILTVQIHAQDKLALEEMATGFSTPVGLEHAGDDRLFVVEKNGYIRIMDLSGQVLPAPFLDIDARVNSNGGERGLLGLAFHPEYQSNGYFFVNYTNSAGSTVISRFSRDAVNDDLADPDSEEILLTQSQPFSNHNGGHLAFGPDHYLYIGLGDGGSAGDPGNRAQNKEVLLGKMLRIDVNAGPPYGIPPGNPYLGVDTIQQEIWATGMRNPWRYSFDRMTGDLWIADVGQDMWEEIDFQAAGTPGGQNYGWRCKEGFANFNTNGCPPADSLTDPVYAYSHTGAGCSGSVTGGFVYRGSQHPYFWGKYLFTDYCTGVFRSLTRDSSGTVESELLADLQNGEFTSFGEDVNGELYVTGGSGRVYRVVSLVSSVTVDDHEELMIRPNPASGSFRISGVEGNGYTVRISDVLGNTGDLIRIGDEREIDCSGLPAGLYLVTLSSQSGFFRQGKLLLVR